MRSDKKHTHRARIASCVHTDGMHKTPGGESASGPLLWTDIERICLYTLGVQTMTIDLRKKSMESSV